MVAPTGMSSGSGGSIGSAGTGGTGTGGTSGTATVADGPGRSSPPLLPSSPPTAIPNIPTVRSGSDSRRTTGRVAVL